MKYGWLSSLCLVACAADSPTPVFFEVEYESAYAESFATATGWQVELTQARVAVGPLRLLHEEHGEHGANESGSLIARMADLVVPVAHAHGGAGELSDELAGESIDQVGFDLLGEAYGAEGRGYLGPVNAFEVAVEPPGELTLGEVDAFGAAPAVVAGVARKDGVTIEFLGDLPHLEDEDEEGGVHGTGELELVEFELASDGTFVVTVDPSRWFDEAAFDTLTQTDQDGRHLITMSSQVGLAWQSAQGEAFSASWEPAD
jgi:hypothetical protein